jgi:hemolysin activation/secretion protein
VKKTTRNMMILLQILLFSAFCSTAWAKEPLNEKDYPQGMRPGATEKAMEKETVPQRSQLPKITIEDEKTGGLKGGEGVMFELQSVAFEGNSVIPTQELNQVVEGFLDETMEVSDLNQIADKVTSYYIESGYILTRAYLPPQTISSGRVMVRVREGRLGKIIVRGNERYKKEIIKNVIMVMKKKGAVKTTDLERSLLLLMDYPALSVKATLLAGDDPGTTDIVVDVTEGRMMGGGLDYNNYGSEYVSKHRFGGNVSLYNPTGYGDRLNAMFNLGFTSGDLLYGRVEYAIPVLYRGTKIGLVASLLDYEAGKELEELEMEGEGVTVGTWISHPIIRTRNLSLYGDFGIDYKRSQTDTAITHEDRLLVARLGGTLDWLDKYNGRNIFSARIAQGLKNEDLEMRYGAEAQFTKFEFRYNRFQRHVYDVNTIISLAAQYSNDRVPSSEMLHLGGAGTVRGYDQGEHSGDMGLYGTFEVRVPVWKKKTLDWTILNDKGCVLQVATFLDYGTMKKNDATDTKLKLSEITDADLMGAGLGLRFAMSPYLQAKLDWSRSLSGDDPIDDEGKWYLQISTFY